MELHIVLRMRYCVTNERDETVSVILCLNPSNTQSLTMCQLAPSSETGGYSAAKWHHSHYARSSKPVAMKMPTITSS